ncbi:MAG: hypothetical protein KDA45_06465 [Planctomycetales bacterium]|nr:hypothetical protein [Planctomycetales bacterium]
MATVLQINPFLLSVAAPAAAKTVQAVAHAAHDVGQGFMRTLTQFGQGDVASTEATATDTLEQQLSSFASKFRRWLDDHGVQGSFEMQFELGADGSQISNVIGRDSEQIVDLLYSQGNWLTQLTELASRAQSKVSAGGSLAPVKLAISADDAFILNLPVAAI